MTRLIVNNTDTAPGIFFSFQSITDSRRGKKKRRRKKEKKERKKKKKKFVVGKTRRWNFEEKVTGMNPPSRFFRCRP